MLTHSWILSFCSCAASQPLVSKLKNSRRSIAAIAGNVDAAYKDAAGSLSGDVSVSKGDVKAELKKAEAMATLNKV